MSSSENCARSKDSAKGILRLSLSNNHCFPSSLYYDTSLSPTSSLQMFLCVGLSFCLVLCALVSSFLFPDSPLSPALCLSVCPYFSDSLSLTRFLSCMNAFPFNVTVHICRSSWGEDFGQEDTVVQKQIACILYQVVLSPHRI